MNSCGHPTCYEDVSGTASCPALLEPMTAGDFHPAGWEGEERDDSSTPEEVARYPVHGSRAAYVFKVQPCRGGRWHAWGDWCPQGRTPTDACYEFLDGGGTFTSRRTAAWAIQTFLAHWHEGDSPTSPTFA